MSSPTKTQKRKLSKDEMQSLRVMAEYVLLHPEIKEIYHELLAFLDDDNAFSWHECYEYHPEKLNRVLIHGMGFQYFTDISDCTIPKDSDFLSEEKAKRLMEIWDKKRLPIASRALAIGALLAKTYDMECVGRHGVHMYDLLKIGKNGNDKAFYNAIKVDPAVIGTFAITKRYNKALSTGDSDFIDKYDKAKNANEKRFTLQGKQMRITLGILYETEQSNLPNEELHTLFKELKIINPNDDLRENVKTLRAKFLKTKKEIK